MEGNADDVFLRCVTIDLCFRPAAFVHVTGQLCKLQNIKSKTVFTLYVIQQFFEKKQFDWL